MGWLWALWWKQLMKIEEKDFTTLVDIAKRQIAEGDVRMLVGKTLYTLYAALPPTWRVKSETDVKRHFHLFMQMLGANVQAEEGTAFGYADAIVETKKAVYVFVKITTNMLWYLILSSLKRLAVGMLMKMIIYIIKI